MSVPVTFVRVGRDGKPDGLYGEEYETAAIRGVDRASGGKCHAEFVRAPDVPELVRDLGWWSKLALFDPDLDIGMDDVVFYSDLDNVFIRNLPELLEAMYAVRADIVGIAGWYDGHWDNGLMMIRRGSPSANRVWSAVCAMTERPKQKSPEAAFIEKLSHVGTLPPHFVAGYPHVAGIVDLPMAIPCGSLDEISVLMFAGAPKPWDLYRNIEFAPGRAIGGRAAIRPGDVWPLRDFAMDHWRP